MRATIRKHIENNLAGRPRRRQWKQNCASVGHRWSYLHKPTLFDKGLWFRVCERKDCKEIQWET